jgi:hypothetical protein
VKSFLLSLLAVGVSAVAVAQIRTPSASPAATVSQSVGLAKITVEYARPSLKGRKMFGEQVPFGKVWRTGANAITKLTISDAVTMNGQPVKAGSYGLFTIPGAADWTIILSKRATGSPFAYKDSEDTLRFIVKTEKAPRPTEVFTIEFTDFTATSANLTLRWEDVQVNIPVTNDPDSRIMAQIMEQTAKADANPNVFFAAADYYYNQNRDLKQALTWSNKVLEKSKEYWTYALRARIEQKLGDCPAARADATASLELARKAGDDAYIKGGEKILADCK